jgi:tetratricopeptide (TPR) repeat protein
MFRYQDEVEAYSQAIECNPKDAFLYYQRSSIYYYYLKDINNAREDVKKSLQMEPNRSYAKQLLERIESELGN